MTQLSNFHPVIARWFELRFGEPTAPQRLGWDAIRSGRHTLIAAPARVPQPELRGGPDETRTRTFIHLREGGVLPITPQAHRRERR